MKHIFSLVILSATLTDCSYESLNSNMRIKYVEALQHYSLPQDSLKRDALVFLLHNMEGKSGLDPVESQQWVDTYRELYALAQDEDFDYKRDFLRERGVFVESQCSRIDDTTIITSAHLIENIDLAFDAWEKPWAKHLSFEEFCNYILPYRIQNEPYHPQWRSFLKGEFAYLTDSLEKAGVTDPFEVCEVLSVALHRKSKAYIPPLPFINVVDYYHYPIGDCYKWHILHCLAARAIGIPLAIDFNLQFTRFPGGHPGTVLTNDGSGKLISFLMNVDHTVLTYAYDGVKIYREEFAKLPENFVNRFYPEHRNKNIRDVTSGYSHHFPKQDISLPVSNKAWREGMFLCSFSTGEHIIPIAIPEITKDSVYLKDLLLITEALFLFGSYSKSSRRFIPVSNPFSISKDGKVRFFDPEGRKERVRIRRKYPRLYDEEPYFREIQGARIQGSNDRQFKDAVTLDSIVVDPLSYYEFLIPPHVPFRYYRYVPLPGTPVNLAELHFYTDSSGYKKGGYFSSLFQATSMFQNLYDDHIATNCIMKEHPWIGIDMGGASMPGLTKVGVLARNNLNNIEKRNLYELFYFDRKWISIGQKVADGLLLEWESVPANAIFLLKNRTSGVQERVFMNEGGEQNFF